MILKRKKGSSETVVSSRSAVFAADDDPFAGAEFIDESEVGVEDAIDDLADNVEDLQDSVDEVVEDDVNILPENNIESHYIAECEKCHGIFISALVESDQVVESISGVCPLCEKETIQNLRWVIKAIE